MIYLDNAATSHPKPESVYARMDRFAREVGANPGRGGHRMAVEAEAEIDAVRRALAALFGAREPSRIVFTLNATDALNMAMKGLLRQGDHVVTSTLEHNSVSRPLAGLERDGVVRVTRVTPAIDGSIDPSDVMKALEDRTRLVVLGQASNVLGTAQPIREVGRLLRERGPLLLVDAAQGAGLLAIDVEADGIDMLVFTGHKSLLGPPGTGGLCVGARADLRCWREGGTGGDSAQPTQPSGYPHRMEAGTPNTVGIAGLGEALRFLASRGTAALAAHEVGLALRLWEALEGDRRFMLYGQKPEANRPRTGVVCLNVAGMAAPEAGALLDSSFGIAVRAGLHCAPGAHRLIGTFPDGTLRVSPGPFSTADDIDALTAALHEIADAS